MTWRERALLGLTIVGFVVPHAMGLALVPFIIERGLDVSGFLTVFFETRRSAQLAADVIIAFVPFALWAAWEGRRIGMSTWWLPIPASAVVAFCFAVPLFLLLRERALREIRLGAGRSEPS
jgi:uncharacterized protein DUF2834